VRLLAVGDIHGYLDKLTALMEMVAPTQEDRVVFLGDYIDRGPDTPGVIEYLIGFGKKFPKTIFIGGNHDHLLLGVLQSHDIIPFVNRAKKYKRIGEVPVFDYTPGPAFIRNGGFRTVRQYGGDLLDIPRSHIEFLADCYLYHEETVDRQTYLFVHAGVFPSRSLEKQYPEHLLWIRDPFYLHGGRKKETTDYGMDGRIIVHGHTPGLEVPGTHPYRISLDSGVCQNPEEFEGRGRLTCCNVLTREIWQV